MQKFIIEGKNNQSQILIGEKIGNLNKYLPAGKVIVITDANLMKHYSSLFTDFITIVIRPGEINKNLSTIESIYEKLMKLDADRSTFILGFGGGIVCDISGYVASTYMRGMNFGFVSTSLLSQVDASTGGKNGVNFRNYKNMIGTFNQPQFVICDHSLLNTLPEKEIRSGFGEIIKHCLIADEEMFSFLENNIKSALSLKPEIIEKLVLSSIKIKAGIVNIDETEKGERRKLNFGHTLGHAIESVSGLTHGEAISIGMVSAARLSNYYKLISEEKTERIEKLITAYGLPASTNINFNIIFDRLIKDKKCDNNSIHFILLDDIGKATIKIIKLEELKIALKDNKNHRRKSP
ncbi:MAG: 3-dehydroquinate synthase [Bacteroidota bacterium]|nr:3-dehydroquinate synthase [Bacteroidota bacterium]